MHESLFRDVFQRASRFEHEVAFGEKDRFCGGSVEQLLVGMVANHVVDEQELQRLAQRIAGRKTRKEK